MRFIFLFFFLLFLFPLSSHAGVVRYSDYALSAAQIEDLKLIIKESKVAINNHQKVNNEPTVNPNNALPLLPKVVTNIRFSFIDERLRLNLKDYVITEIHTLANGTLDHIMMASQTTPDWTIRLEFDALMLYDYRLQGFLISIVGQHETHYIQVAKDYSVLATTTDIH